LGIHLKCSEDHKDSKPISVVADEDKIYEVLLNLVGNSLKFTPKGGEVEVLLERDDNEVVTHVIDNGVGIEPSAMKNLFKKFGLMKGSYRTNKISTQGTGLGLYISKLIVDLHKGKIWAKSRGKDKGTQFSFALPRYSSIRLNKFKEAYKKTTGISLIHNGV
jgi:signal transduction histidine kinase